MMTLPSHEEIAWAAGLFEGEGCISYTTHPRRKNNGVYLQLTMVDEDVVRHFGYIVQLGRVDGPHYSKQKLKNGGDKKPYWYWKVHGLEKVQAIVAWFWPWLGDRRKQRAIKLMNDTWLIDTGRGSNRSRLCAEEGCNLPASTVGRCPSHRAKFVYESRRVHSECDYCRKSFMRHVKSKANFCSFSCLAKGLNLGHYMRRPEGKYGRYAQVASTDPR
jgi:hypothetical protein